jgi:hypothetical protein
MSGNRPVALLALAAGVILSVGLPLAAGCGRGGDTGTVVVQTPETLQRDRDEAKKRIETVKNNPNIPEGQKQMILGRLQAQAGAGAGETDARRTATQKAATGANTNAGNSGSK